MLLNWDSGWYSDIINNGYSGVNFAFYPLFPLFVRALKVVSPNSVGAEMVGSIFSSLLFLGFGYLVSRLVKRRSATHSMYGFIPQSLLAWFFFVWSPASYIFQTNHTESLFTCLSMAAFLACHHKRFFMASFLAGICCLTKNQGIFVAISVGYWLSTHEQKAGPKILKFAISGLISGSLWALFPLYSYLKSGDLGAFYTAQSHWRADMSIESYFKTLIFGNPWQNTNAGSINRYFLFWALVLSVISVLRKHRALGLYMALFVGVMPLSGELVTTCRYSSVLWPAWFTFAGWVESSPIYKNKYALAIVVVIVCYINQCSTRSFALGRWAY